MGEYTFKVEVDGELRDAEMLFTFQSEETNKDYIVYTLNEFDENGNMVVHASSMDIENVIDGNVSLKPLSDEEYELVDVALKNLLEDINNGNLD